MPCLHTAAHGHTCMSSPREGPRLYCCARYNLPGSEKGRGGGGADYKRQQKKCIEVIAGVENHEARQLLQSAENSLPF